MKKMTTLKMMVLTMIIALFVTDNANAQEPVEIPKDDWTAYAYRYRDWGLPEWAINDDRTDASIFGMGGSSSEGRWFMVDMGESHLVVSVLLEYLRTGDNYIKGFNVYVTDKEYPFQPAVEPGGADMAGELFDFTHADVEDPAAVVEFPTAERVQEVVFDEPVKGRYIWIVANGPGAEWWEMHQFSAFTIKQDDPIVTENEVPKDDWTAHAYRYRTWGMPEWAIDNDRTDHSIFGLGASATAGSWFMVDMGDSYLLDSVLLEYLRTGTNYIQGFNLYITDKQYPFQPATEPGESDEVAGDEFDFSHPDVEVPAAVIDYPTAERVQEIVFDAPVQGRYIWIVSNGPMADWWELHEFTAYGKKAVTNVSALKSPVFTMFPNPLRPNNRLTVNIENGIGRELRIIDITGRVVYSNKNLTQGQNMLEVNLNSGMYIVSIPGQTAQKLIVK